MQGKCLPLACLSALLMLAGCASGYDELDALRTNAAWTVRTFTDSATPSVAAYRAAPTTHRSATPADHLPELWVYIEGDGRSWISRRQISNDPTPDHSVALQLARIPQPAHVLYLARPCQYMKILSAPCPSRLWSQERYSAAVVSHLNHVLDQYVATTQTRRLILVGYSGGGVLATLLAARRTDVDGLITLAANLSLSTWVEHHKITPLSGSLDPTREAAAVAGVPQVHMVGLNDQIVPPAIVQQFVNSVPAPAQLTLHEEPAFTHDCCWASEWPRLRSVAEAALVR